MDNDYDDIKSLIREAVQHELADLEERVSINEAAFQAALALAVATARTIPSVLRQEIAKRFDQAIEQTLASMLHDDGDRTGAQYNRLEALRSDILPILRDDGS